MAEATAAKMSGANDGAAAVAQEKVQETAEAGVSSLPADADATVAAPAAEAVAEPAAAATIPETKAEGDAEGAAADTAAAPAEARAAESSVDAAGESTSGGGFFEPPRPPPAAVLRSTTSNSQALNQDDEIAPVTSASGALICNITLLLPTGNRHPFKIDDRYLTKRGVEVPDVTEAGFKDPFSVSVYKLKELILREWREDWESKPASPSSIRLIHFGKLLDDKEQLKKYHFSTDSPNVVHMSVKPPEMVEDEEAAKNTSGGREARRREGGSGCCVIL
ncbi:uncharacterized protein SPSK_07834 [Sporothrix schenckii 1099-18]|nr:uncharacterized protein SPSK_07834 [Sporothrix schenckii 1099-18]KJR87936.1 hypothetical protein SPSK_07834 [Sporothrix schenckii 1099-18]